MMLSVLSLVLAFSLSTQARPISASIERIGEAERLWDEDKVSEAENIYKEVIQNGDALSKSVAHAQYGFRLVEAERPAEANVHFAAVDLQSVDSAPETV